MSTDQVTCEVCHNAHAAGHNEGWAYLSFASDTEFLGGVIIQCGNNPAIASMVAHAKGINPGGEMLMLELPVDHVPDEKWRNRLLSKAEVYEMWPDSVRLGDVESNE